MCDFIKSLLRKKEDGMKLSETIAYGMKQGIQSVFPHPMIKEYGCYFLALLKFAEIILKVSYTEEDILRFYNEFVGRGWIRETCYVNNAVAILNFCIGKTQYKESKWLHEKTNGDPLFIMQLTKPGYEHYILGVTDPDGTVTTWDSLDPLRPAAKEYRTNLFGVFL